MLTYSQISIKYRRQIIATVTYVRKGKHTHAHTEADTTQHKPRTRTHRDQKRKYTTNIHEKKNNKQTIERTNKCSIHNFISLLV